MSRKPRRGDVVEIEWADAQHISLGWDKSQAYLRAAAKPQVFSAGYLIGESAKAIVLVLSIHPGEGNVLQGASIPKAMIRKTTVLGRGSRRVRKALRP